MWRMILPGLLMVLGMLLAGCGSEPVVIPTVAQLPTVTPVEEVFFTPTPVVMPETGETPSGGDAENLGEGGEPGPALATPTPETLADQGGGGSDGPCAQAEMDVLLAEADLGALRADLDAFMAGLRERAAVLGEWTLSDEPDPFAGEGTGGTLPLASLRYRRGEQQAANVLVMRTSGALRDFMDVCLEDAAYFREGDFSARTTVTVERLGIGDHGAVATVVEPVDPETSDTGLAEWRTEIYAVLIGDTVIQYINIPAMDEAMGLTPVSRSDVILLLSGLVDAARGL